MYSHWYDPEPGAAAHPGTVARRLVAQGNAVDVVTGFPIYPSGRLAPGYRIRPYQREVLRGVTVHRSPIYPSHDARARGRMANYLSYAVTGSAVATRVLGGCDVGLVYSSPTTAAVPALVTRALRRVPYVVLVEDLWPQTVTSSGFLASHSAGRVERMLHAFCDTVYRGAHSIAVTSPGMADLIADRGVPESKLHVTPNWAEEESFRPVPRDERLASELGMTRPFRLMYAGNLGEMQDLDVLLDAASRLGDLHDVEVVLVGDGVRAAALRGRAAALGLDNVTFVPPQPFGRMAAVLALGDVQLISLKDVPLYRSTLPSKLQATLACGRPILAALTGDAAEVVSTSGAGVVVPPGDPGALAEAVRGLRATDPHHLAHLGQLAREHYDREFSEQVVGARLQVLLEAAAR